MTKDIFVFAEQRDGNLHPAALQCVTVASQLAAKTGGRVVVGLIGSGVGPAAARFDGVGVAAVLIADHARFAKYNCLSYTRALAALIAKAPLPPTSAKLRCWPASRSAAWTVPTIVPATARL